MNKDDIKANDNKKIKECKEYNALKYKTMILTGTNNFDNKINNETNETKLDNFLLNEKKMNKSQSWNKITKTDKINKIKNFINNVLKDKYELTEDEIVHTNIFILKLLDRKRLTKNNEITYSVEKGEIENINILLFNKDNRKFTLNYEKNKITKKTLKKKDTL